VRARSWPWHAACSLAPLMVLTIKQLAVDNRPRERLLLAGPAALTDPELVALLFGGDLPTAEAIVARFGAAAQLRGATLGGLCTVPGVGPTRAAQVLAAVELGRRAVGAAMARDAPLRGPQQAHAQLRDLIGQEQEELRVLALDARQRLLARFVSAVGLVNVVHVSPRDIFRRALREGAVSVIIAHNHPSGDPTPSEEDVQLTRRLRAAGELLGVPMLDHLIVAEEGFYSFTEGRILRP